MTQRVGDDGTLYVSQQGGKVVAIRNGLVDPNAVLDISNETVAEGERGLLNVAFSPKDTSLMYVYFTDRAGDIHVTEFKIGADNKADVRTRRDLLMIEHSANSNHNGGQLQFGPDGHLYIGVGDGGGSGDPSSTLRISPSLGKILRINPTR